MKVKNLGTGGMGSRHGGFTMVELMIVVAIVSVLALIALPVYLDYTVRSKVSESIVFLAEAKSSVSEGYYNSYAMPTDNESAGLQDPNSYNFYQYIRKLEVTSLPVAGTITVTVKLPGTISDYKRLQLVPRIIDGGIEWTCQPAAVDGIKSSHVPAICRGG